MKIMPARNLSLFLLPLLIVPFGCRRLYTGAGPISRVIAEAFTPDDMYYPRLLEAEVDLSRRGVAGVWSFEHRYRGGHVAGLYLQGAWDDPEFRSKDHALSPLELNVTLYQGEAAVRSFHVTAEEFFPFTLKRELGRGYEFLRYETPAGIPFEGPLSVAVEVETPDAELARAYGPIFFFIRKVYDFSDPEFDPGG